MRESWLISIVVLSTLAGCPSNEVGDDEVGFKIEDRSINDTRHLPTSGIGHA